jgi:uncharacterized short protein YbdD (DUF466 family)
MRSRAAIDRVLGTPRAGARGETKTEHTMLLNLANAGSSVGRAGRYLGQTLRLMVGVPDYDGYLAHMKLNHPDVPAMSYAEFFRNRQDARYGGKGRIGCC